MADKPLLPATRAARLGGYVDPQSAGVVPPLQTSTTFVRGADYALLRPDNVYGRNDNDPVRLAEAVIADLEGATEALLFPSGMAAIAAVFRALPTGARVVLQSGIYWGTTVWVRRFCARRGVELVEADCADPAVLAGLGPMDLLFIETPSNPWLKVTDIAAAARVAHRHGGLLVVDSTAATPVLQQPLALGADVVMHSATKAMGGHSDLLAGVLAVQDAGLPLWDAVKADRAEAGAIIGPFEAWLLLRSLRTLPLRVARMSETAFALATKLAGHPGIEDVFYPGLATAPGHPVATSQMAGGYGGLLSVVVAGGAEVALAVAGRLALFHRATSLGGVESLVEHRPSIEPDSGLPPGLLRLSIGIEDAGDLWDDLTAALAG